MSFAMMAQAAKIKTGSAARKMVLMMLADIADESGRCFPSYKYLADVCEMSRRSVIAHIDGLEAAGLLKVTHRKTGKRNENQTNIYTLSLTPSESFASEGGGENIAPPPSENISPPSANPAPPPSENSAPRTYHSFYPTTEPKKPKPKNGLCLDGLPVWLDTDLIQDFIVMRKRKAPLTQRGLTILINKLSKLMAQGHDPTELLEEAILQNWKSVWPPTGDRHATRQHTDNSALGRVRAHNAQREAERRRHERAIN